MTWSPSTSSAQADCLPYNTFTSYAVGPTLVISGVPTKGPAINEFANRVLFLALGNQTATDPFSNSYLIGSNKTIFGIVEIVPTVLKSLAACLLYCSLNLGDDCSAVTFTGYPPPATGAIVFNRPRSFFGITLVFPFPTHFPFLNACMHTHRMRSGRCNGVF